MFTNSAFYTHIYSMSMIILSCNIYIHVLWIIFTYFEYEIYKFTQTHIYINL